MQMVERRLASENRSDFDQRDIMSESDPEGDRLDMGELLKECQNKTIRKKLENTEKRERVKKVEGKRDKGIEQKMEHRVQSEFKD